LKLCGKDLSFSVAEGIRRDAASHFEWQVFTERVAFVVFGAAVAAENVADDIR